MGTNIKDNIKRTRSTEKESILLFAEIFTKGNGRMAVKKEKEFKFTKMEKGMKDNLKMAVDKEKVFSIMHVG